MNDELFNIVWESEDFRDTFFKNFSYNIQDTPYARARYEKRYLLRKIKYYQKDRKYKIWQYLRFLEEVIKATRLNE